MNRRHISAAFACALFLSTAAADDHTTRARDLVELMGYSEQFAEFHKNCVAAETPVSPAELVARNPTYFKGIRPGHKHWPEIVEAYERYYQTVCDRPTQTEFLNAIVDSYEGLSSDELRRTNEFYSSSTGRKLVVATKAATVALYESVNAIRAEHLAAAKAAFDRLILKIENDH